VGEELQEVLPQSQASDTKAVNVLSRYIRNGDIFQCSPEESIQNKASRVQLEFSEKCFEFHAPVPDREDFFSKSPEICDDFV
jgi:hypothetical protein